MDNLNKDLHFAYWDLCAARESYERADAFYDGTVEEVYASRKVQSLLSKSGYKDMDDFNFAHIPVDVIASKMVIQSIQSEDDTTNVLVEDLWDYNELGEIIPLLHRDAGKYGDAYMMVWPVVNAKGVTEAIDMTLKSPLTTRVFYDSENDRVKAFAIQSWCEGEGRNMIVRANLYYSDRVERYVNVGKVSKDIKKNKWEFYTQDGMEGVLPNPTGQVPFFHFRTSRNYGIPDHINAYGPQLVINKIISSMAATLDYQAFPQRYVLLDPSVDNPSGNSDFDPDAPEDSDGFPQDLANGSNLIADPGAVWEGTWKAAGQFQATDMNNYLGPLDRSIKAMAQVTEIPMHAFESTGDAISGESRRLADAPVNNRVNARQNVFGSVHRRMWAFVLDLVGASTDDVAVMWEPLEVVQDKQGWEVITAKVALGIPLDVVFTEAGYTQEQADEWAAKKQSADKAAAKAAQDALNAQTQTQPTDPNMQQDMSAQDNQATK